MPSKADDLLSGYSNGQILDEKTLKELRELRALEQGMMPKPIPAASSAGRLVSFAAKAVIVGTPSASTQNDSGDQPSSLGNEGDSPKICPFQEEGHGVHDYDYGAVADGDIYIPGHSPRSNTSISATLTAAALKMRGHAEEEDSGLTQRGILSRVRKISSSAYRLAKAFWSSESSRSRLSGRPRFGSDSASFDDQSEAAGRRPTAAGFMSMSRRRINSGEADVFSDVSVSNRGMPLSFLHARALFCFGFDSYKYRF
jgi:hypothetical protein